MAKSSKKTSRARREEDELEQEYRKISKSGKKSKKKKSNRAGGIIAVTIALIAIVFFVAAGYLYIQNMQMNGIILENVSVAGVDVGGMTQTAAIEVVRQATDRTYTQIPMEVTVLGSKIQIPTSCVGSLNVTGAVRAAYKFGNSGSTEKRQSEQQIAMKDGYAVDLTPYLNIKEDQIRKLLSKLGENFNTTLNQSKYDVTGEYPNQKLVITLGTPEYGLDLNALYSSVLAAYSANRFQVEGQCGMLMPDPINLEEIAEKYYKAPVDASFNPEDYQVIEGVDGYGLNVEKAQKKLDNAKYGTTVEIAFEKISPEVTAEDLKNMLYRDTLATYTSETKSDSARDINLRLACEAINGKVLLPDDVFSYNEQLGEPTKEKGYRLGKSYNENEASKTIGGGICQVSSALYYCTLVAELETLTRDPHGYYPGYVPLGMDAAVSWGSIDFRFRNTTDYPIRIDAEASDGSVTITLVGTETRNYRVELEYEVLSESDYDVTYQNMSADNKDGYKDGDYIVEPRKGYNVKSDRCKFHNTTGEQLIREFIDQSNYKVLDGIVCRIAGSNNDGIDKSGVTDQPGELP